MLRYLSNDSEVNKISYDQKLFNRAKTYCSKTELKITEENYLFRMFQRNEYLRNFMRIDLNGIKRKQVGQEI